LKNQYTKFRLGDIADVQTGPFGSQLHQKDYVNEGTPIITVEHLGENRILHNNMPNVSDKDKERLSKYQIFEGDIVFSRVGSVDRRAYVRKEEDGWLFSGRCLRVRVKDQNVSPLYLSYYFGLESFKEYIRRIAVGATMPSINTQILSDIEVHLPSKNYQDRIADILSTIDAKIEIDRKINITLEEIGWNLYKYWFIDFGHLSESEMVVTPEGKIPKGWKTTYIENAVDVLGGGTPKTKVKEYWDNGTINWYSPTDLTSQKSLFTSQSAKKITKLGLDKSSAKLFLPYSVMMTSRATIGVISINTTEASTNQGFITLIPNENFTMYQLYYWLKENMELILSISNGSTFKEVSKTNFKKLSIIKPVGVNEFNNKCSNIFKQIESNLIEIDELTRIREYILSRLLSGEVSLSEAEKQVEEIIK
jgi:type I restriction enzyme, S subunit